MQTQFDSGTNSAEQKREAKAQIILGGTLTCLSSANYFFSRAKKTNISEEPFNCLPLVRASKEREREKDERKTQCYLNQSATKNSDK